MHNCSNKVRMEKSARNDDYYDYEFYQDDGSLTIMIDDRSAPPSPESKDVISYNLISEICIEEESNDECLLPDIPVDPERQVTEADDDTVCSIQSSYSSVHEEVSSTSSNVVDGEENTSLANDERVTATSNVGSEKHGNDMDDHIEISKISDATTSPDPINKNEKELKTKPEKKIKPSHTCPTCGKIFTKRRNLTLHTRLHTKIYECRLCQKSFVTEHRLSQHKLIIHKKKPYKCSQCKNCFETEGILNKHFLVNHTNHRPYECHICGKGFSHPFDVNRHIKIHSMLRVKVKCPECLKLFSSKLNLKYHMIRIHSSDQSLKFQCKVCNRWYARKSELVDHLRVHTGEKPFQCSECDRRFSSSHRINSHYQLYHNRNRLHFLCEVCTKTFRSPKELRAHYKTHNNVQSYECTLCKRSFGHYQYLQRHIQCKHLNITVTCLFCQKEFTKVGLLSVHHRSHFHNNNYKCPKCGREFAKYYKLQAHYRKVHTVEDGIEKCEHCGCCFKNERSLASHYQWCSEVTKARVCRM